MTEAINPSDAVSGMYEIALAKAQQDPAFKAELLANPRAALEKTFAVEIPAHITLKSVEQPADTYVIVVPTGVTVGTDGELSDESLEAVAGGSKAGATKFFNDAAGGLEAAGRGIGSSVAGVGQALYTGAESGSMKQGRQAARSGVKSCQ